MSGHWSLSVFVQLMQRRPSWSVGGACVRAGIRSRFGRAGRAAAADNDDISSCLLMAELCTGESGGARRPAPPPQPTRLTNTRVHEAKLPDGDKFVPSGEAERAFERPLVPLVGIIREQTKAAAFVATTNSWRRCGEIVSCDSARVCFRA
jgi:hypothetical protein